MSSKISRTRSTVQPRRCVARLREKNIVDLDTNWRERAPVIRTAMAGDIPAICDIYNFYVRNTIVTFEEAPVSTDEMHARVRMIGENFPWLVYEEENQILGYAYANKWKERSAYRYSAESTVYLHPEKTGKGIGTRLYSHLMGVLKEKSFHAVFGGIALPNEGSCALHEKLGFKKVAHLKEVGYKFDRWIDVGYWQLLL